MSEMQDRWDLSYLYGGFDDEFSIVLIALGEELPRLGHALRGFEQALPFRVLSQEFENGLYMPRKFLCYSLIVFFRFVVCHGTKFAIRKKVRKITKNNLLYRIFTYLCALN